MERRNSGVKMFTKQLYTEGLSVFGALTIVAPLERYLILVQTKSLYKQNDSYKSFGNYLSSVTKREGIKGFWRGNTANIINYYLFSLVKFRTYRWVREKIYSDTKPQGSELIGKEVITVFLSTLFSQLLAYPSELARVCVAADLSLKGELRQYSGTYDCIQKTFRSVGVKGCYNGLALSLGTSVPFIALSYSFHDRLSSYCENPIVQTASFVTSAVLAHSVLYPLEVLRRRRQVGDGIKYKDEPKFAYKQILKVWNQEGLRGFYRGIVLNSVRSVLLISLQFSIYEWVNGSHLN